MTLKWNHVFICWLAVNPTPALHASATAASATTAAETAAEKGHAIAAEAERRDTGWESFSSTPRLAVPSTSRVAR